MISNRLVYHLFFCKLQHCETFGTILPREITLQTIESQILRPDATSFLPKFNGHVLQSEKACASVIYLTSVIDLALHAGVLHSNHAIMLIVK